jgi:uncharacterized protein YaaN involved in tellurite resistance
MDNIMLSKLKLDIQERYQSDARIFQALQKIFNALDHGNDSLLGFLPIYDSQLLDAFKIILKVLGDQYDGDLNVLMDRFLDALKDELEKSDSQITKRLIQKRLDDLQELRSRYHQSTKQSAA